MSMSNVDFPTVYLEEAESGQLLLSDGDDRCPSGALCRGWGILLTRREIDTLAFLFTIRQRIEAYECFADPYFGSWSRTGAFRQSPIRSTPPRLCRFLTKTKHVDIAKIRARIFLVHCLNAFRKSLTSIAVGIEVALALRHGPNRNVINTLLVYIIDTLDAFLGLVVLFLLPFPCLPSMVPVRHQRRARPACYGCYRPRIRFP